MIVNEISLVIQNRVPKPNKFFILLFILQALLFYGYMLVISVQERYKHTRPTNHQSSQGLLVIMLILIIASREEPRLLI